MLGTGSAAGAPGRSARVNLSRRFSIVAEAAHGSMSRVYKAFDNESGRTVCLKVQDAEKNQAAAARAGREEDKPFEGEIGEKILSPHVVRTYEHGVSTRGEPFVVMEFINGVSLQYLRESRTYPRLRDRLKLLAQAAEGVAAVHAAGFIHHDISPLNFLVTPDPVVVKLIDLGLAVPNTPAFQKPGNRTGTLNYMAPELIRREPIDERIDVFAFGVMAFEFLTGRLPYETSTSMKTMIVRINSEPLDPARVNPDLPESVNVLLRKLTARRKEDRWPNMRTAAEELLAIRSRIPRSGRAPGKADD
jgi:serine/threonine protein kinase